MEFLVVLSQTLEPNNFRALKMSRRFDLKLNHRSPDHSCLNQIDNNLSGY